MTQEVSGLQATVLFLTSWLDHCVVVDLDIGLTLHLNLSLGLDNLSFHQGSFASRLEDREPVQLSLALFFAPSSFALGAINDFGIEPWELVGFFWIRSNSILLQVPSPRAT